MRKKGFTLVEILIVVAITVIIGTLLYMNLGSKKNRTVFDGVVRQAVSTLREAQNKSITQSSSSGWGVHFDNAAAPSFSLFYGSSYSTTTSVSVVKLPVGINYANIASGSSQDATFAQLSGMPSSSGPIILQYTAGGGVFASTTIIINTSTGLISF